MHLLRLFLAVWIEFGIATVFFLYWLATRTAQRINTLDKPVLDQDSFQQLLSAAYTLQEKIARWSRKLKRTPPDRFAAARAGADGSL